MTTPTEHTLHISGYEGDPPVEHPHQCPGCGGELFLALGVLGELLWRRCRACGLESAMDLEWM